MGKMVPVYPNADVAAAIVEALKGTTSNPGEAFGTLLVAIRILNRPPYRTNEPTNEELAEEVRFAMATMVETNDDTFVMPPTTSMAN